MAVTMTTDSPRSRNARFDGSGKVRYGTGNLGVYATNGIAVAPTDFQPRLRTLDHLDLSNSTDGTTLFVWDKANGKIKAFSAVGTEVTNSTDITSKVFRFMAKGT